ncbi:MAG: hypothetical protein QXG98_03190 [Candidatus Micrarchaeia archaeon]
MYAISATVRTLLSQRSRQLLRKIRALETERIYNGKELFEEIVSDRRAVPPAELYLFEGHPLGANILSELAKKATEKGEYDTRYKCARALGRAAELGDLTWNRLIGRRIKDADLGACELERSRVLSAIRRGMCRLWMRAHERALPEIITESGLRPGCSEQQLFDFVLMHGASAVPAAQWLLVSRHPPERLLGARIVRELYLYAHAALALRLTSESNRIRNACLRAIKSALAREEYSELKRDMENMLRMEGEGNKYLSALRAKIATEMLADAELPAEKRLAAARCLCETSFESPALAAHIMATLLPLYDKGGNLAPVISGVLLNNSSLTRLCTPAIAELLGEAIKRHGELVLSIIEKFERYSDDAVCEKVLDAVVEHINRSTWDVKKDGVACMLQLVQHFSEHFQEEVKITLWLIYKSAVERKKQIEKGPSGAFVMLDPQSDTIVRSGGDKTELEEINEIVQLIDASPFGDEFKHNLALNGIKPS